MTSGVVQVQTTLPDEPTARHVAAALVEAHLAACVQVLGPVHSTYRWEGQVNEAVEWLCLIKTTAATLDALLPRIRSLHPYDCPEIIVLPIVTGDPGYLDWVGRAVSGEQ